MGPMMLEVEHPWVKLENSHKDDKWLLHFFLGLCQTRLVRIHWDDPCQENPNDPVVLHNLGVALTEEGDGNWQRLRV